MLHEKFSKTFSDSVKRHWGYYVYIDRQLYLRHNLTEILRETRKILKSIKNEKFDLVVDFQGFGETALITWLSGTESRWGFPRSDFRKRFYNFYLQQVKSQHAIEHNIELLETAGLKTVEVKNNYKPSQDILHKALQMFYSFGYVPDKPTIFIQPFTHFENKNWPLQNFLELAQYLDNKGGQIIFGGGPGDKDKLQEIAKRFPVTAGKASIMENVGLMWLSTLVVGGDTGLLHIATAMGKPVIMLMGPTRPERYGPYGHPERVITANDTKDIRTINVEQLIHKIQKEFEDIVEKNIS